MPTLAKCLSSNIAVIIITGVLTYSAIGIISTLSGMMLLAPFTIDAILGIKHMVRPKEESPYEKF